MDSISLNSVITVLALLAAILTALSKLRWAAEQTAARNELVKAKEAQIETLRLQIQLLNEQTSPQLFENFSRVRHHYEEINGELNDQLRDALELGSRKDEEVATLRKRIDMLLPIAIQAIRVNEKTLLSWRESDQELSLLLFKSSSEVEVNASQKEPVELPLDKREPSPTMRNNADRATDNDTDGTA
jgi:hypothetical protein